MAIYDAFISYSHAKDKPIAAVLQSVIQTLGKPWYKRRALRIFRDDTNLSATPHLWPTIAIALSESRYLVLLASGDQLGGRSHFRSRHKDQGRPRRATAPSCSRRSRLPRKPRRSFSHSPTAIHPTCSTGAIFRSTITISLS